MAIRIDNTDKTISYECEKCNNIMFTFGKDNPVEYEKNFINNKHKTKIYYRCPICNIKHRVILTANNGYELVPLEDNFNYVECLKCEEKIYADEIKYINNNSAMICPKCNTKHMVRFEGPIRITKLIKIIE